MNGIKLVEDTITIDELHRLADWIKKDPRLTKGELTKDFEKQWSGWLGSQESTFVNSGSSANLLMAAALKYGKKLKNNTIIAPTVSWGTTVAPFMQLGFNVELCDCELDTFGIDPIELEKAFIKHDPAALIVVHVLGIPCKIDEIVELCKKYDVVLLEDCCEAHGAEFDKSKVGTFGEMSSFSYYYGHHMSTVEGGMVSFNSSEYYEISLMLRSHGWIRDLDPAKQQEIISKHKISDFDAMYFFLYPGFNIRSTEINAFLGLSQLEKLDQKVDARNKIWHEYDKMLHGIIQNQKPHNNMLVSPLAFGLISDNRNKIVKALQENNIECRPLICGSIHMHPFWKKGGTFKNAELIHKQGLYIPVHHNMSVTDVKFASKVIQKAIQ